MQRGLEELRNCERKSLLGKVCADRRVGLEVLRNMMLKAWKVDKSIVFKHLGDNLLAIIFVSSEDRDKVISGRPWLFDNVVFVLKPVDLGVQPQATDLHTECFWIQFQQLPIECMNQTIGEEIGNSIGRVLVVDVPNDGIGWGPFLWVLIEVDLCKPVSWGRTIKYGSRNMWIPTQWEKLPRMCFACGRMFHGKEICTPFGSTR